MNNKTNDWLQKLQPGDKVVVVKEDCRSGGVRRRTHKVVRITDTHIHVKYAKYRKSDGTFDGNPDYIKGWGWMPFLQEYTPEFEAEVDAALGNFNKEVLNMSWLML